MKIKNIILNIYKYNIQEESVMRTETHDICIYNNLNLFAKLRVWGSGIYIH